MKSKIFSLLLLILATSCVETVVVGSVVGGTLAVRDKTLVQTKDDIGIVATLTSDFMQNGLEEPGKAIGVSANEGRVMFVGVVKDEADANLATSLAWKVTGVKEVIDEIQIDPNASAFNNVGRGFIDFFITTEVKSRLLIASQVALRNYNVTTFRGTVYLLGIAQNDEEIAKALSVTARTYGVKKVVNHIILANGRARN